MKTTVQINQPESLVVRKVLNSLNDIITKATVETQFCDINIAKANHERFGEGYTINDTFVWDEEMATQLVEEILLSERVEAIQEVLYDPEGGEVNINAKGLQPIVIKVTPINDMYSIIKGDRCVMIECFYYDMYKPNKIVSSYRMYDVRLHDMNGMVIGEMINHVLYNTYPEYMKVNKRPDNNGVLEVEKNDKFMIHKNEVTLDLHGVANEASLALATLALENANTFINKMVVSTDHIVVLRGEPIYQ